MKCLGINVCAQKCAEIDVENYKILMKETKDIHK
jgi:hypothetical protein